jgi:hypothetical protein
MTRAGKSWTTLSAVAQVPLLLATHSRLSRPPFSWAIHTTATACPTTWEHARPKAYVQPSSFLILQANVITSSPLAHQASNVRPLAPPSSNRTATPRTHTAATATTPMLTSSTLTSTAPRRLRSSRASLPHKRVASDGKRLAWKAREVLRCKYFSGMKLCICINSICIAQNRREICYIGGAANLFF